jgi:hypothetical protein
MKKMFRSFLTVCATSTLLLTATTAPAAYAAGDQIKVERGGVALQFEQNPFLYQDRTFVPLRAIFENIGAMVQWNDKTSTVTATKDDVTVQLTIGNTIAYRNGVQIDLDAPPMIRGSRSFVPVRFIAESFNTPVKWDGATKTVRLMESNRKRLEEVLQAIKVETMHVDGNITTTLKDPTFGTQTLKAKYAMDFAHNEKDNLTNLHMNVNPSGALAFLFGKFEVYVKDNQLYYQSPSDAKWYAYKPKDGSSTPITELSPTQLKTLAKYAILDEQDTQDMVTFYVNQASFSSVQAQAGQAVPQGNDLKAMKLVVNLDKKTNVPKDFTIDSKLNTTIYGPVDLRIDGKTTKINEAVMITLPDAAKKATPTDKLPIPAL